jgi:hypothetical protein
VGVKPNTWKSWDLESSRSPECLELDSKGQNNSHWGVLGVVGKVLKNVNIENGLALAIWTSAAKLWAKEGLGVKLAV